MTFSTKLKEEIVNNESSKNILISELTAILRYDAIINKQNITLTFENGAIARRIYKSLKELFNVHINIIIRNQKRLRAKQIYILEIKENVMNILENLHIYQNNRFHAISEEDLKSKEQIMGFVRGIFLANGSINDPKTSGYHLEFVFMVKSDANFLNNLLHQMNFHSKVLKRNNRYMCYLKASEEISDMIRLFEAPNCLFYFEDIRIYRDHKNMLNRLNNCDIANQEKSIKTGFNQLEDIKFLKDNDLISLLDEKTLIVIKAREENPESSYQELAEIITNEYGYHIGKSGINHHFIKIKKLINNYKQNK